ncbi:MAG: hypothetical protein EA369_02120 [Bradymonadales bacterium]|nr:MAG: hypothetical protein EA369_02120 [Bradymonadales bacterium]
MKLTRHNHRLKTSKLRLPPIFDLEEFLESQSTETALEEEVLRSGAFSHRRHTALFEELEGEPDEPDLSQLDHLSSKWL